MRRSPLLLLLPLLASCAAFHRTASVPRYQVFFTQASSQLEGRAYGTIAEAASRAVARPADHVYVLGYTDSAGSLPADLKLAEERAQVVTDALIANGVPPRRIIREGRGPTTGDMRVERRRVEIDIAP